MVPNADSPSTDTPTATAPPPPPPPPKKPAIPPTVGRVVNCFSNRWDGVRTASIARVLYDRETGELKAIRVNVQLDGIDDADLLSDIRSSHTGNTFEVLNATVYPPDVAVPVPLEGDYVFAAWMPFQTGQAAGSDQVKGAITQLQDAIGELRSRVIYAEKDIGELESKQNTLLSQFAEHLAQAAPPPADPTPIPPAVVDPAASAAATTNEAATQAAPPAAET